MEGLKQKILEHLADLLDETEFELDMILQDCKDPKTRDKSDLHLLMTDAAFKAFCAYFNKKDLTEQCNINVVGVPNGEQLKCECKQATFTRIVTSDYEPQCGKCWKPI